MGKKKHDSDSSSSSSDSNDDSDSLQDKKHSKKPKRRSRSSSRDKSRGSKRKSSPNNDNDKRKRMVDSSENRKGHSSNSSNRHRHEDRRRDDRRHVRHDRSRDYNRRHDHRDNDYHERDKDRRNRDDRPNHRSRRRSGSYDHANAKWGKHDSKPETKKSDKEKPNFGLSGKLTEETNTYRGVVIKYSEPPEARKPKRRWRLYPFKGEKALQTLYIHRESGYLIGRDRKVVDLPVDHPSCSKQHAALQYRLVPFTRDDGSAGKRVRPYLIDLESANGTFINNQKIEAKKYVELLERDVIKFGFSSREYVLLHENSKDEALDDDVKQEDEEVRVKDEKE